MAQLFFYLALSFGLQDDPPSAVARAVGFIEAAGQALGVEHPIQMTVATSNGEGLWFFRYSSERKSRSLFYSTAVDTLRTQHPDHPLLQKVSSESRLVVSEPLGSLAGAWNEVPESTCGVIHKGKEELRPFVPLSP